MIIKATKQTYEGYLSSCSFFNEILIKPGSGDRILETCRISAGTRLFWESIFPRFLLKRMGEKVLCLPMDFYSYTESVYTISSLSTEYCGLRNIQSSLTSFATSPIIPTQCPVSFKVRYNPSTGSCHAMLKHFNSWSASCDNWCTVGGDGGCRVGEVWASTTSPMPDHKGFKLQ